MDAVAYSLASKQAQRIEKFIENPDSTSGIVTVPKTIASGETVTVPAGRVAVLPNIVVDGTLNIDGEVFIPSGSSVDFSNGIKVDGNNIALSIPTSYHLLQGNLSATINANYVEVSATTTRNYATSDYIFDSLNNKLYDCISASTSGVLLTNTTYFTSITAGTLSINNAIIPLAHGIDSNGSKNSIVVANETITGLTYTQGKNYLYKTDTGYGVKPYEPRYLSSELVRRFAGEQPDYYDVNSNKWFNTDAGSELVSNGKFDVNTSGWTLSGSCVISNGTMLISNSGASASQIITGLDPLKKYKLKGNMSFVSGTNIGWFTVNGVTYGNVTANYQLDITVSGVSQIVLSLNVGTTAVYSFDNVTCFATDITPTTEITESRNYLNHIVHADQNGQVTYVEELPKVEYKDVIKANEYRGKNALIAYALVDMTTTPPTIKSSFNVSGCIRLSSGVGNLYLSTPTDTSSVSAICGSSAGGTVTAVSNSMITFATGGTNYALTNIYVFGGQ